MYLFCLWYYYLAGYCYFCFYRCLCFHLMLGFVRFFGKRASMRSYPRKNDFHYDFDFYYSWCLSCHCLECYCSCLMICYLIYWMKKKGWSRICFSCSWSSWSEYSRCGLSFRTTSVIQNCICYFGNFQKENILECWSWQNMIHYCYHCNFLRCQFLS